MKKALINVGVKVLTGAVAVLTIEVIKGTIDKQIDRKIEEEMNKRFGEIEEDESEE